MIDLHTHILPAMDDGSPSVRCSVSMLEREQQQGVDTVCLSSHYYASQENIETFCQRRQNAFDKLKKALADCEDIAIGKPLMSSLAFPPLHTVHAAFIAHGVPSFHISIIKSFNYISFILRAQTGSHPAICLSLFSFCVCSVLNLNRLR